MIDDESEDGSWAGYIADMQKLGRLKVESKPEYRIAELEHMLYKAERKIRKLEEANRLLSEMIV